MPLFVIAQIEMYSTTKLMSQLCMEVRVQDETSHSTLGADRVKGFAQKQQWLCRTAWI